jgi:broad specificity phosphatase PhoE
MRTSNHAARSLAAVALLLVTGAGFQNAPEASTTIFVVRHAEKAADGGSDPALSPLGKQRATALGDALAEAEVRAIYVTQYQRTALTARPLAVRLGITPTVLPAQPDVAAHARAVASDILARHAGEAVLVVGHSNTAPAIVRALGGAAPEVLADNEFDNLFIVTVPPTGRPLTVRVRYGEANAERTPVPNKM